MLYTDPADDNKSAIRFAFAAMMNVQAPLRRASRLSDMMALGRQSMGGLPIREPAPVSHHRGARPIVLVVESDDVVRESIVDILATDGYRVAEAANGRAALDALRGGLIPALIVLDLMMPVMNGWKFRIEQAADPAMAKIPVVIMLADGETPLDQSVLSAAGLLRKPVSPDALLVAAARLTRG